MKKAILFFSLFICSILVFGQNDTISNIVTRTIIIEDTIRLVEGNFKFNHNVPEPFSEQEEYGSDSSISISKGHRISVLYEDDDYVYYKYLRFTNKNLRTTYNGDKGNKVFKLQKKQFEQLTIPLYPKYKGVNVGAYSVPFRLRDIGGNNFDFESSLSLQANLVFGFGSIYQKESKLDTSFGIGITGVNLNDKNSAVMEDRTASALTISLGAVYRPAKFANIGLFLGWDFLGQRDKEVNWVHDGDAWLGIGINVSFDEIATDKQSNKNTEQPSKKKK